MIITRRKKIPLHWAFYAQLPLLLSIYGNFVINAPFLLIIKQFIDSPAAIMGLISIEVYVTLIGGPLVAWLSDRIWTRFGRRKFFLVIADFTSGLILLGMPFAPNLWVLIALRWAYGAVRDFGQVTQALAYEVVPAPQRGRSSGFFSAMINFGNLIFFFLVLGRFDDAYFMGPFALLGEVSGGVAMFALAATLLIGIAAFEALGFKEIEPHDRKRLADGRRPGENVLRHFVRAFFKDVFALDLLPVYLLLIVNVMFGVGLGIFQPLLFTEQWGYSLQDLGNTVAVGVFFAVALSLTAGWAADRIGKLNAFIIANAGSLVMNVAYTIFVATRPDDRPTLGQIILFGNLGLAFGMLKSVVTFPLRMEYVRRNRMGASAAGAGLFDNLLRNTIALFVGVWLGWWSTWFHPQAGYYVEATLAAETAEAGVRDALRGGGLNPDDYLLRPLHQYGVDGDTSRRWWVHRQDDAVGDLLAEKKDLDAELATLRNSLNSPFADDAARQAAEEEVARVRARLSAIDAELSAGTDAVAAAVGPALEPSRYPAGAQVRAASVGGSRLALEVETIEPLPAGGAADIARFMQGPEHALERDDEPDAAFEFRPRIAVEPVAAETGDALLGDAGGGLPAVRLTIDLDPQFAALHRAAVDAGVAPQRAYALASSVVGVARGVIGRDAAAYDVSAVAATLDGEAGAGGGGTLAFDLGGVDADTAGGLADALRAESAFASATATPAGDAFRVEAAFKPADPGPATAEEVRGRLADLAGGGPADVELLAQAYARFADAVAGRPTYVTVPRNALASGFLDREYEYFFSSQTLVIATDLLGFVLVGVLIALERRGTIRRYGVEEDQAR